MKKSIILLLVCIILSMAACASARQATSAGNSIEGKVVGSKGNPVAGAMVTAHRVGGVLTISVFTNKSGQYRIEDVKAGKYSIRASYDGFQSPPLEVDPKLSSPPYNLSLEAQRHPYVTGAQAISLIPDGLEKRRFVQNCFMCHAIGMSGTAFEGTNEPEFWLGAIDRMVTGRGAFLSPDFNRKEQALLLAKYLPPNPEPDLPSSAPPVTDVIIYEFDPPKPDFYPHDICVDSKSRIWAADMGNDVLEMLDPKTEEWKLYPYPVKKAGAHSIIESPDGKIWIVLQVANQIASFDPSTEEFRLYRVPDPGKMSIGPRPHTHVFDSKGNLWYTEIAANRVSKLEPKTGHITVYDLPEQPDLFRDSFWLWPYGIAIDSQDSIYYSKLGGNRIGKIDSSSGKIEEYEMPIPYSGPRRLDTDSKGNLWVPAFTIGKLYRFDPQTKQFKEFQILTTNSAPYALYVDKKKDRVYICEAAADRIGVFDIAAETFSEVLLPSQFGYTRKIDQDKNTGMIWTSYSQSPTKHNKVVGIRFTK
ncbi:MAG: carboxypeptidase regulatory-like domain-containing protein [Acidobacteria bacterium]|nr:carboxypeptidase regulatory-like domain-containing protein [Acidobacteriota bacterium]